MGRLKRHTYYYKAANVISDIIMAARPSNWPFIVMYVCCMYYKPYKCDSRLVGVSTRGVSVIVIVSEVVSVTVIG